MWASMRLRWSFYHHMAVTEAAEDWSCALALPRRRGCAAERTAVRQRSRCGGGPGAAHLILDGN
eukprot:365255-Chlamydomonas_euryale.AAC.9